MPDINDPAFAAAVAAARHVPQARHADGTMGALLAQWRASQEWAVTAPATKASRDRYLDAVEGAAWQARQVVDLPPDGFRQLRAELLDLRDGIARVRGPGAATVFGQAVASLFAWAVDRGKMVASPLTRLRALEGGHIPAWTQADARKAMEKWPEPIRRAVTLNYHLGQRRGDLTMLRWDAYDPASGIITLQPEKTRRKREAAGKGPLRLVVSSALAWELRRWRDEAPAAEFILTRPDGRQWTRGALSMAIRKRLQAEGWPTKRGLHGLRKLLAQSYKEAGASDGEIGAAQGWDSARTIRLYTEGADQEKMARAALDRLENAVAKSGKRRRK
ncbi:tyrosine-type recombinase/integrase [Roseomonas frigidaquae]|uniref:Tyrosine-type recombinase/integrase n=1 Tax=Falsiroseomonas frigidaquae TaxID=487318 RepID=A0ABX1ETM6_9PROT|nr:tyrosine-type recombinase/integrase [Falsiroseomonas frigidaquae]NKE43422.1 tyrosine-type recombinase/integrase [Falsiroseomonas frigidaquae]